MPVQVLVDLRFEASKVVGVDAVKPRLERADARLRAKTQHFVPACREEDFASRHRPVPQAVVRAAQRQGVALFAQGQLLLCPHPRKLRSHASQHHRQIDRFGDVVVRAQIERFHDVFALRPRG